MKVIGITGRSGSGKGYVCARFAAYGLPVIDTDEVVHRLYRENEACIGELEAAFGTLRLPTGEIDRKKLAAVVFSDKGALQKLNAIVHRYVALEIDRQCEALRAEGREVVLIDAPQLFEAQLEKKCDFIIAVTAPETLRILRICSRDGISEEMVQRRLNSQLSDAFFESNCDVVIVNDGSCDMDSQVKAVLDRVKNL